MKHEECIEVGKLSHEALGRKVYKLLQGHSQGGHIRLGRETVWVVTDKKWKTYNTNSWRSRAEKAEQSLKSAREALQRIQDLHFECDGGEACDAHNIAKEALSTSPKESARVDVEKLERIINPHNSEIVHYSKHDAKILAKEIASHFTPLRVSASKMTAITGDLVEKNFLKGR